MLAAMADWLLRGIAACGAVPHCGAVPYAGLSPCGAVPHCGAVPVAGLPFPGFPARLLLCPCVALTFSCAGLLLFPVRGSFFGSAVARRRAVAVARRCRPSCVGRGTSSKTDPPSLPPCAGCDASSLTDPPSLPPCADCGAPSVTDPLSPSSVRGFAVRLP